ncbi:MAG: N-6 DNA methylase [Candidatus Atribacteria bacterium]|nr:N-6 DNA methylase [Candidatus Atribacteria bacterium]
MLKAYLKEIAQTTIRGDAREETYYGTLKELLEDFPLQKGRKTQVTTLPKQTEAGNPDFRVWDGENFIVGYIEAKSPGTNLDQIETSEQLERYLNTFPNLILTDFYEFRLYREGELIDKVSIGRHFTARQLKATPPLESVEEFTTLLEKFFAFKLPKTFTAEKLAVELAKRTRFLRDQVVVEELRDEDAGGGDLSRFYKAFKRYLIASLTPEQFADLYSQTITYGLFAARTRANGEFNRKLAFDYIPPTIGILRDVFRFISWGELSPQMAVIVEDITAVLNAADINSILDQYYKEGRGEDPIVHFYETFLNEYDPQTRERRGVYYTPEPVVKYIVRSVHQLLKEKFDLPDGLADPKVTVLDPAAGTLTFPAEAIRLAVEEYVEKYGEGGKKGFIRDQILKNFYAFELMMAPYAIGHMKISILLESLGYKLQADDRFQLYLTNTLEMEEIDQIDIPGIHSLSEESQLAGRVKKEEPILVIIGNPPYSAIPANTNEWTEKLLKEDVDEAQSYYKIDDAPLGERTSQWLQDDYVKFLRFAQWKIQKAGQGIVAMITNHSYLDNPTFRGMRQSLMKTFTEIYILDLHGNKLKREKSPNGSKDDNVFEIRQGVAITIFIRQSQYGEKFIKHQHLFGVRDHKYNWLLTYDVNNANYERIFPRSPFYFFIPRKTKDIQYYLDWLQITDIFPLNGIGMTTARDDFVIDENKHELINRIMTFKNSDLDDEGLHEVFEIREKKGWSIRDAWNHLQHIDDSDLVNYIEKVLYRLFDDRYIFYHDSIVWRTAKRVMNHMLNGENIALLTKRQGKREPYSYFFVSDLICESCVFESSYANNSLFPLYLYSNNKQKELFDEMGNERKPNILPDLSKKLNSSFSKILSPEEIFNYIYGIFYSNIFRDTYREFLKVDFPRVPFTADFELFKKISLKGKDLVDLHLLRSPLIDQHSVRYQGTGDNNFIKKPIYIEEDKHLKINDSYYFEGVEPYIWKYQIGGRRVLASYLKYKRGRRMSDPRHFIHIATALEKTIEIQEEIDAIYPEVEKDLIEFS